MALKLLNRRKRTVGHQEWKRVFEPETIMQQLTMHRPSTSVQTKMKQFHSAIHFYWRCHKVFSTWPWSSSITFICQPFVNPLPEAFLPIMTLCHLNMATVAMLSTCHRPSLPSSGIIWLSYWFLHHIDSSFNLSHHGLHKNCFPSDLPIHILVGKGKAAYPM